LVRQLERTLHIRDIFRSKKFQSTDQEGRLKRIKQIPNRTENFRSKKALKKPKTNKTEY
jgi:hypothetical protein